MEVWKIIVGLIAAAVAFHIRNAYVLAQKQRLITFRLHSYLYYWRLYVMEKDIFALYYLGMEWNKEERDLIRKRAGAEALVKLQTDKRAEIAKKVEEQWEGGLKEDLLGPEAIEKLKRTISTLPDKTLDNILKSVQQLEQNLLDGKTFINDDDACALGPLHAQRCVRLKMNVISAANQVVELMIPLLHNPDLISFEKLPKQISDLIWKSVLIAKDIDTLSMYVDKRREQSILSMTWKNLWF